MANNPNVNKVVYGNQTVMDISDTTAEEGDVVSGKTFYKASGARSTGSAVIPDISNCYQTTDTVDSSLVLDDDDYIPVYDYSASTKKNTVWSNIKAKLKAYFDTVYATLNSPAFTGTPTAPTAASGTNTTQIATTAFVQGEAEKKAIELTKAQYDALPASEKEDPTKVYYVKDYDPSVDIIDDTTTASNKVWSSSKTSSEIASVKGWKILATAPSNQTFKAQLEYLKPYFMALTNDEKLSCVLQVGGWAICPLMDVTTGGFFRTNAVCTVVVYYMNYSGAGKYVNTGTDQSTTVNTETLTLLRQK